MHDPDPRHVQLGQAMRAVRRHLGHPQKLLANRMGGTRQHLSAFENGRELPIPDTWHRWLKAVGTTKPAGSGRDQQLHDLLQRARKLYEHTQTPDAAQPGAATRQPWVIAVQDASLEPVDISPGQDDDVRRAAFLKLAAASGFALADTGLPGRVQATVRDGEASALVTLPDTSWASPIYQAVLDPLEAARTVASDGVARYPLDRTPRLRRAADAVIHASLASEYAHLTEALPVLIGHAELASLQARAADRPDAWRLLSDVYAVAGWALIKADSPAAAWIAAQRAVQLAERADDVLRSAAAMRCLSEVYMRAGSLEEASHSAFLAATHLDTARSSEQRGTVLCLRGAALLSAAAAAARRGDSREARTALKAAAVCADDLNEDRADLGTVFGPSNVAIHQVAVAVELGNAREALQHAPTVKLDRMPRHLIERRVRFLIDVARSHAQLDDHSATLEALLQAERIAPDELRNHRLTHELIRSLLMHARRSSGLRALADRCKLLN